ncbi:MAG: DNA polymerase III subunit gamma/tau [Acutalibacteraceae bacterium]|nr:DNA polymerase III subunit gamma/tau [Acutalibacteraceae bacterium]
MYQALYRKYRPTVFSEVVGQEHITNTISGSLKTGKISHAYLFTGTRGTGKTTCAKILAKAVCCENPVNGEPCGECEACRVIAEGNTTDINEIDAASNNGVNDIRDLKEQVSFLPTTLKYRVYIIDEVHMLSINAFNALLKTLEEPPSHVVFILATTEVHKLPATILSRCQRFDFKRLEPSVIVKRINYIAEREGFTVTSGAATMIASLADGGMRDALSILDQCSAASNDIDETVIRDVCGIAGNENIFALVSAINNNDTATALQRVDTLYRNSVDMKKLIFELISCYRNLMIIKTVKSPRGLMVCSEDEFSKLTEMAEGYTLSGIIDNLTTLQEMSENLSQAASRSDVELVIVKLCSPELASSVTGLKARVERLEKTLATLNSGKMPIASQTGVSPSQNSAVIHKAKQSMVEDIPLPEPPVSNENPISFENAPKKVSPVYNTDSEPTPVSQWPEILEILKTSCPLMAGVLVDSKAYIGGGRLLIDSQLDQFKDLINSDAKYRDYIRKAAEQVLGVSYNLGPYKPPARSDDNNAPDPLAEFVKSLNG